MRKLLAFLLCAISLLTFCSCGKNGGGATTNPADSTKPQGTGNTGETLVYFLNFKPEIADVYDRIATAYKQETGVTVKVVTAASDTYEQTLMSEIAKKDAPTIFQLNGPIGYQSWKKYCLDLSDTALYSFLSDPTLAIIDDGGIYGIPYVIEGYGIIYNNDIVEDYFELENRATDFVSMDQINNFEKLKALVEDMQAHKGELEIDGVFASTSFSSGNHWRWNTHLANIPLYYELKKNTEFDDTVTAGLKTAEIGFDYSENFKNIFDLYIENSGTQKGLLGSKSVNDSMAEFALGKVAMVQNGTWSWADINGVAGNDVEQDDIRFLPIYTGVEGEEAQGLCVGTENYLAINSQVSADKQKASIAFLEWLFSSETGKRFVLEELNFITPFNTFTQAEKPKDPLAKELVNWTQKSGVTSVPWTFASFPSEVFKERMSSALLEYAQGNGKWSDVENTVKNSWKEEFAANAR